MAGSPRNKCQPRVPFKRWAEDAGLQDGYRETQNWAYFEDFMDHYQRGCGGTATGVVLGCVATTGGSGFSGATRMIDWTLESYVDGFFDVFDLVANGYQNISSETWLVQVDYDLSFNYTPPARDVVLETWIDTPVASLIAPQTTEPFNATITAHSGSTHVPVAPTELIDLWAKVTRVGSPDPTFGVSEARFGVTVLGPAAVVEHS